MVAPNFDTLFPKDYHGWKGSVDLKVIDEDKDPNRVLEIGKPWSVDVTWDIQGSNATAICGTWVMSLRLESMGKGFEGEIISRKVGYDTYNKPTPPNHLTWQQSFNFPDTAFLTPPDEEGVYRLVLLITYKDSNNTPLPMAGMIDAGLLTWYQAEP